MINVMNHIFLTGAQAYFFLAMLMYCSKSCLGIDHSFTQTKKSLYFISVLVKTATVRISLNYRCIVLFVNIIPVIVCKTSFFKSNQKLLSNFNVLLLLLPVAPPHSTSCALQESECGKQETLAVWEEMSAKSSVIKFGYLNHKRKDTAVGKLCNATLTETAGTTSNFYQH